MADSVLITPGVGDTIAADDIGGVKFQRVKLIHGADGTNDGDVSSANPLPVVASVAGSVAVYFDRGEPTIKGITNSIGVYVDSIRQTIGVRVGQIDGTVAVYFDKSGPTVNNSATMCVGSAGGSVSGQYVGISDLGVTIVAPEANHNTKVYAFSIITTAQVQIVPKFTNGAGAATELWRVALQAPAQGISGVSQSIQPPGYLFATGINTTLALRLDSASLVHYSISYFKESA